MDCEIFKKSGGEYTLPNGKVKTSEEFLEDPEYTLLAKSTCVVFLNDGVMTSYETLDNFAKQHSVKYESVEQPSDVLNKILDAIEKEKKFESYDDRDEIGAAVKLASYLALSVPDEIALKVPDLYPVWAPNTEYEQDERITYNSQLYKVAQKHTSQDTDGWRPGETGSAALYSAVTIGSSGHDQWKMPTGAHDAYNMDDIVEYNGKLYQSKMDGNTTIPGQSRFWVEYTE